MENRYQSIISQGWSRRFTARGQVIIEYILLLVIVLGLFAIVQSGLIRANLSQAFTQKAWGRIDTMVQCGVWQTECVAALHPEAVDRVISLKP